MGPVKRLDGKGYLKDATGEYVDSSLFINDPIELDLKAEINMVKIEKRSIYKPLVVPTKNK